MCNLYSYTKSQDEARRLMRVLGDRTGNQPPLPAIFPDQMAPVVRTGRDGVREMLPMRWGLPSPQAGGRPVTNIRNVKSGGGSPGSTRAGAAWCRRLRSANGPIRRPR